MAGRFSMIITSAATCAVGLVFLSICYLPVAPVTALFFNFTSFGTDGSNDLRTEGEAYIHRGWIDLTAFGNNAINNSRGRVSYAGPMHLWDRDTSEVASFVTHFSFVINPPDMYGGISNKGAGMAFFLAGYPSRMPSESETYNLGLTNQSADAVATGDGRFVAVEFDTFNDTMALDPHSTYDHIGIDVNSIRSVDTEVLPSFSLQGNMTAEIRYDNVSTVLELKLWLGDGRNRNYTLSQKVDLKSALPEIVSVGFSASTSASVELHQLYSWYFNSSLESKATPVLHVPPPPPQTTPSTSGSTRSGVIARATVGSAAVFVVAVFALAAFLARRRRSKRSELEMAQEFGEEENIGSSDDDDGGHEPIRKIEMGTGPRRFPYHELVAATRSFAPEEKLGQGGFGSVYRGHLTSDHNGGLAAVAIKRFAKGSSTQGRKEYKSEIKVISRLRHRNLVQLVGWCHGRDELLLVYELLPNRSLDVHLHGNGGTFLTWPMRMRIVLGLGSALLYLHEEWEQCVVHRDVKPSNVMLDEFFNAKLGDFGLARFINHAVGMRTMTTVWGTPGYVDPESLITGKASAESDVYSFGVVVLEVACGRRPMSLLGGGVSQRNDVFRLVEWAWDLYGRGAALAAADERLNGEYDAAEVERVVAVGLWCAHPDPRARPSVREAMAALQSNGPVRPLPAKMPVPTYAPPVASLEGLFSYTATTSGMTSSSLTQSSSMTMTSAPNISAS
jgi:serine/threonine protein kinase